MRSDRMNFCLSMPYPDAQYVFHGSGPWNIRLCQLLKRISRFGLDEFYSGRRILYRSYEISQGNCKGCASFNIVEESHEIFFSLTVRSHAENQPPSFSENSRNSDYNVTEIRRNRVGKVQFVTLGFFYLGIVGQFSSSKCVDNELWRNPAHRSVNGRRLGLGCLKRELFTTLSSSLSSRGLIV